MHFPSRAIVLAGLLLTQTLNALAWEKVDRSVAAGWQGANSGGESVCGCTTFTYTTTGAWIWSPSAAPVDDGAWGSQNASLSVSAGSASSWSSDPRETPVPTTNGRAWGGHTTSSSVSAVSAYSWPSGSSSTVAYTSGSDPTNGFTYSLSASGSSSTQGGPPSSSARGYVSGQRSWSNSVSTPSTSRTSPPPSWTVMSASTAIFLTSADATSSPTSSDPSWQLGDGMNEWTCVYATTDYITYDTTDYITSATTVYATVTDNFTSTTTQSYTSSYTTTTTYTTTSPTTYTTTTTTTTTSPSTTTTTTTSPTTTTTTTTSPTTTTTTTTSPTTTTTTSPTTTTTTTTTTSATPLATACNPGGAQPTFLLIASGTGTVDDGEYAILSNMGNNDVVTFTPTVADGTTFTFDNACDLVGSNGEIANIDAGSTGENIFFNTASQIAAGGYVAATCNIIDYALECVDQTATILYVCTDSLALQISTVVPAGCAAVTLTPIYQ